MSRPLSKTSVLDDLAAQLAARRRPTYQRRLAYQRLARVVLGQPAATAWPRHTRPARSRPMAAAA